MLFCTGNFKFGPYTWSEELFHSSKSQHWRAAEGPSEEPKLIGSKSAGWLPSIRPLSGVAASKTKDMGEWKIGAAVQQKTLAWLIRLCPALMNFDDDAGHSFRLRPFACSRQSFCQCRVGLGLCPTIWDNQFIFPLIQHLADRRLWWSGNGRHGSFSPASTQTPLATTLEAGKLIRCFQLQS